MAFLTERYLKQINGVIFCYDRLIITGTLPQLCYAQGMTSYMYIHGIRIFDYAKFVQPFREQLRANAEALAKANNIEIEFVRKQHIRKEDLVKKVLAKRGYAPGLVHILSAMEACDSYKPWHDKSTGKTYLKPDTGRCLHYYFYFIDEQMGLCYIRVPTWCPFKLQIYLNGHNMLAAKLDREQIKYSTVDNAFDFIADYNRAQELSDELDIEQLQKLLAASNRRYLEFISTFDDYSAGQKNLTRITQPMTKNNRKYKGFNFFEPDDLNLLLTITRGEFNISGFQNKTVRKHLTTKTTGQISRFIKRLRMHGLIRKAKNAYKYYLTKLGRNVILSALKIKELIIVPKLAY